MKRSSKSGSARFLAPRSSNYQNSSMFDESFTVNQLRFSSLDLYGRDEDFDTLKQAYQDIESTQEKKGMVLVSGYNGTGKVGSNSQGTP